jgi:hypothetical protein
MSAESSKKSGFVFLVGEADPLLESYLTSVFDEDTEQDIEEIKLEMEEKKLFTQISKIKVLLFPLEIVLTYMFMDKKWVTDKIEANRLYWNFLRGKITMDQMKQSLIRMMEV